MNDELDKLLEQFTHDQLAGQLGRAEAHFAAHHADAPPAPPSVHRRPYAFWRWAALATAAAAAIVLVALVLPRGPAAPENRPVAKEASPGFIPEGTLADGQQLLDRQTWSRDLDAGTLLLDDHTPVRVIHQQTVEQSRYYDPAAGAYTTVTVPKDKVRLVNLTTY